MTIYSNSKLVFNLSIRSKQKVLQILLPLKVQEELMMGRIENRALIHRRVKALNIPPESDGLPLDHGEVVRPLLEVLPVLGLDVHLREVDGGRACNMIKVSNVPAKSSPIVPSIVYCE